MHINYTGMHTFHTHLGVTYFDTNSCFSNRVGNIRLKKGFTFLHTKWQSWTKRKTKFESEWVDKRAKESRHHSFRSQHHRARSS
jgi:hypothetical protein